MFLNLLGSPRLHTDHGSVDLPDALPGYLLAYLAARGHWVLREELAALLWPQATPAEAQRNVRVNLNRLRSLLRTWGVEHTRGGGGIAEVQAVVEVIGDQLAQWRQRRGRSAPGGLCRCRRLGAPIRRPAARAMA